MIYEDVVEEFNELKTKYGYTNFDDLQLVFPNFKRKRFEF